MLRYGLSGLFTLLLLVAATAQTLTVKGVPQQQTTPQQELGAALDALSAPEPPLWNRSLMVEPGMESFDDAMYHAYSIMIHELRKDNLIAGEWKDLMKDRGSRKVSFKKGVARAESANVPEIHYGEMTVLAKFDENRGAENVRLSVAFIHNGIAISPRDYPMEHEKAMQLMYDLSVELNRAVVTEQLDEQEDLLGDLEKDLDNLRKDKDRLERTIEKNQRNLERAQADHHELTNELTTTREQVQALEGRLAFTPDPDQTKELVKMRKEVDRLEKKINRLESDQLDYQREISDAQNAIPENEQAQQAKLQEIEMQKGVIERYRRKLANVR